MRHPKHEERFALLGFLAVGAGATGCRKLVGPQDMLGSEISRTETVDTVEQPRGIFRGNGREPLFDRVALYDQ